MFGFALSTWGDLRSLQSVIIVVGWNEGELASKQTVYTYIHLFFFLLKLDCEPDTQQCVMAVRIYPVSLQWLACSLLAPLERRVQPTLPYFANELISTEGECVCQLEDCLGRLVTNSSIHFTDETQTGRTVWIWLCLKRLTHRYANYAFPCNHCYISQRDSNQPPIYLRAPFLFFTNVFSPLRLTFSGYK